MADWLRKMVFLYHPVWDGALMQPRDGRWTPLVEGGRSLFRPTDLAFGPDGALYILGWGRQYGVVWKDGAQANEGRVFRVTWKQRPPRAKASWLTAKRSKPIAQWSLSELVEDLDALLPVWRINAQDELVRRGPQVMADLRAALDPVDGRRARQTWILWTLGRIEPEDAARDDWFARLAADHRSQHFLNARLQAVRILAHRLRVSGRSAPLPAAVLKLLDDAEPRIRFAVVQAIWQGRQAHALDAIVRRAAVEGDRLTYYALWRTLQNLAPRDHLEQLLEEVMERLPEGNPTRGRRLFFGEEGAACWSCHRVGESGHSFGPDLSAIGDRLDPAHVVRSILRPNELITEGFALLEVELQDGTIHQGILRSETASSLTLARPTLGALKVSKDLIRQRRSLHQSAMPEYHTQLPPPDLADLTAWLMTCRSAEPSPHDVAVDTGLHWSRQDPQLTLKHRDQSLLTYVWEDSAILRPYFKDLHTLDGLRVTRRCPPDPDRGGADHATMHPGLWLAFGDLNGEDFWRNQGRVERVQFLREPRVEEGRASFAVQHRYLRASTREEIGREDATFTVEVGEGGWWLFWESAFSGGQTQLVFGVQEEMGLGIRMASDLRVKGGNGRILNSLGQENGEETWGHRAAWWDYSGVVGERRAGIMVVPVGSPPCWGHTRDYGVMVINPFARPGEGKPKRVEPAEQPWTLRFAVWVHSGSPQIPLAAKENAQRATETFPSPPR